MRRNIFQEPVTEKDLTVILYGRKKCNIQFRMPNAFSAINTSSRIINWNGSCHIRKRLLITHNTAVTDQIRQVTILVNSTTSTNNTYYHCSRPVLVLSSHNQAGPVVIVMTAEGIVNKYSLASESGMKHINLATKRRFGL